MAVEEKKLKIAFCIYRGNPYSGGQGVYTKYMTAALAARGHEVTIFSGPPYPELDDRCELVKVESLDVYRGGDSIRVPRLSEVRSLADLYEFLLTLSGSFCEPKAFGLRLKTHLIPRIHEFDIIHDNQSLNSTLTKVSKRLKPVVTAIHHPITVDRRLDLASAKGLVRRFGVWRWYGFVRSQVRAARKAQQIITVSETSKVDVVKEMGARPENIEVVHVGVDTKIFHPIEGATRRSHRIVTTSSADVVLKGLIYLAKAALILKEEFPDLEVKVLGTPRGDSEVHRFVSENGLGEIFDFVGRVTQDEMVRLYSESTVAVVPSIYEGFSFPSIEAMACGVPLVATYGGAIPEVVGVDGSCAILVPTRDDVALSEAIRTLFNDAELRSTLAANGLSRVFERYTWDRCAEQVERIYARILSDHDGRENDYEVVRD
ncbi:MAG: glycosyltransferase family 4 protein [Actinomycetota bacterium]|nr:glycosyltransferase family 4 protein [Actinomycetota bacterium]